jgi:hypothetical protein
VQYRGKFGSVKPGLPVTRSNFLSFTPRNNRRAERKFYRVKLSGIGGQLSSMADALSAEFMGQKAPLALQKCEVPKAR